VDDKWLTSTYLACHRFVPRYHSCMQQHNVLAFQLFVRNHLHTCFTNPFYHGLPHKLRDLFRISRAVMWQQIWGEVIDFSPTFSAVI